MEPSARASNLCAGPFGRLYDFYIERPWLAQAIGRTVWGVDLTPMYASMAALTALPDGATVVDVPCGGGVALRALRPDQRLRYIAVDLDPTMLERTTARARQRSLTGIETVAADMRELPLPDATADLCLTYSGLHMVHDPDAVVREIARCLRPGATVIGSTFLAAGTRRQRRLFRQGQRRGLNGVCPSHPALVRWLADAGLVDVHAAPTQGFATFHAQKPHQSPAT